MGGVEPVNDQYPRVGGQTVGYLTTQIKEFQEGARQDDLAIFMKAPAHLFHNQQEIQAVALFLSKQKINCEAK